MHGIYVWDCEASKIAKSIWKSTNCFGCSNGLALSGHLRLQRLDFLLGHLGLLVSLLCL